MFVLAYGSNPDEKQVGFLKDAVKDLMGYKGMLMKKFDERNVAISEAMVGSDSSEGFGPLGCLSKQKVVFLASLWEARASLQCAPGVV